MPSIIRTVTIIATSILIALLIAAISTGRARAEGFYVGPLAGVLVMDTTATVGGVKLVDQGGDATIAGIRGGWGHRFDGGFYLGLEAEGFLASGRSRAVVNGSVYSYEVHNGLAGYVRAGWWTQGNALFFARLGVLSLDTSFGRQNIPSAGIGAEVPFAPGWAARIDGGYSWNDVEHYTITAGVVYRF